MLCGAWARPFLAPCPGRSSSVGADANLAQSGRYRSVRVYYSRIATGLANRSARWGCRCSARKDGGPALLQCSRRPVDSGPARRLNPSIAATQIVCLVQRADAPGPPSSAEKPRLKTAAGPTKVNPHIFGTVRESPFLFWLRIGGRSPDTPWAEWTGWTTCFRNSLAFQTVGNGCYWMDAPERLQGPLLVPLISGSRLRRTSSFGVY